MLVRRSHTLEKALSLLAVAAAVVGAAGAAGATLSLLDIRRPASAAMAALGDGVDEFSLRTAGIGNAVQRFGQEAGTLTLVAVAATVISLAAILFHLLRSLRDFGDVRSFVQYLFDRVRLVSHEHRWGTVRDGRSGHPLPFARLTLVAADGREVDRVIADVAGRYGFNAAPERVAGTPVSLRASKGAYYDYRHPGPLPMLTSGAWQADVALDLAGHRAAVHAAMGRHAAMLATAAFWTSVATVPAAISVSPGPLGLLLAAGLAAVMLGRLCGLGMHRRIA